MSTIATRRPLAVRTLTHSPAAWDGFAEFPHDDFAWRRPLDNDHWPWPRASRTYTAAAREYAATLDASRRGQVSTL